MPTTTETEQRSRKAADGLKKRWEQCETLENEMVDLVDRVEVENRELKEDEKTRYDEMKATRARCKEDIRRYEEILEMQSEDRRRHGEPDEPAHDGRVVPATDVADDDRSDARQGPFTSLSDQLLAVRNAVDPGARSDERLFQLRAAATGMSGGVDSEGGHLVQRDFAQGLVEKTHSTGRLLALRPGINRITIGPGRDGLKARAIDESSRVDGQRGGGALAYWEGEADAITATKLKFRVIEMGLEKLTALVYVTDELLQDATALEQIVSLQFAKEFAFKIEDAVINGDGAGKPLGILNSGALVTNAKETSQTAATVVVENIAKMWALLHDASEDGAAWIYNRSVFPQLITMKLGDHGIFLPAGTIAGNMFPMLMGKPLVSAEYLPAVGTLADITLADLTQYWMIEKEGLQTASSIHVRFIEGETAFRFVWRLNGLPVWDKPLTGYKDSIDRSPFVVTALRA